MTICGLNIMILQNNGGNKETFMTKESKRECAIRLLKENGCMINSCLGKDELKKFNGDFVGYLINVLKQNK